ncbi:beta-1,2-xylosyltransferase XYXT1-like isoform X1 [Musa acuminata AAA Group]|uniref:beta-1,2-xylosyltransferase XYXT1-like isoform X1 n=1 Tax=Musa acuminata AAA Group TaxID=214697 RepID=UPI0031CE33CF
MGYHKILAKKLGQMEARKLGLPLLLGFCVGVLTCVVVMSVSTIEQQLSLFYGVWVHPAEEISRDPQISDAGISPNSSVVVRTKQNSPSTMLNNAASTGLIQQNTLRLEHGKGAERDRGKDADERVQRHSSSTTKLSSPKVEIIESKPPDGTMKGMKAREKPVCDLSNYRTDVCEMDGDVRVHGKSSSVVLVTDHQSQDPGVQSSWRIKPYARKFDKAAMEHIGEVSVRSSTSLGDVPRCTVNHSVPAIVFAIGGYSGNYYHDFTDVLIPLFITSRQFDGEVQFLIATQKFWWIGKYKPVLRQLSRHEIIFLDDDDQVRCFRHVVVGLHSHKPMSIDPARAPNGYSMVDFTKLMRSAYSLERDSPIGLGESPTAKPRLLLISRNGTRRFVNFEEIVRAAEKLDYEVVVAEAGTRTNVASFTRVVNSCDVMVGVHGAGLTNFVFLPTNAVIIQIVPFGNLQNISRSCFKDSSEDAQLHYLEYCIGVEESSLTEQYPRDHPVFRDPKSIHRLGWKKMADVYLDHQDVKLDMERFKPLLLKARHLLHHRHHHHHQRQ